MTADRQADGGNDAFRAELQERFKRLVTTDSEVEVVEFAAWLKAHGVRSLAVSDVCFNDESGPEAG